VLDNYNMSLGSGLSKLSGKVFASAISRVQRTHAAGRADRCRDGLSLAGVPHRAARGAAMTLLEERTQSNASAHLKVYRAEHAITRIRFTTSRFEP